MEPTLRLTYSKELAEKAETIEIDVSALERIEKWVQFEWQETRHPAEP